MVRGASDSGSEYAATPHEPRMRYGTGHAPPPQPPRVSAPVAGRERWIKPNTPRALEPESQRDPLLTTKL
jgi:hypothetical protein